MSIINNGLLLASGADAATTYQISRSLRFNSADSPRLARTPGSAGNRKTWTLSCWVKRSKIGSGQQIFSAWSGSGTTQKFSLAFYSDDKLNLAEGSGVQERRRTTQVFRDVGAWFHLVVVADTTLATANDRYKIYVNGSQITTFDITNNPAQNDDTAINQAAEHVFGCQVYGSGLYNDFYDGYLADIYLLDGTATDPSTFAQTDAVTGQWVPKTPASISYGTNGFRLTFSDNSGTTSTTLGKDAAGSNNWTPNNFSVASGSGNDSLVDSPSSYGTDDSLGGSVRGNYATLNPLNKGANCTLTNGNLDWASNSTSGMLAQSTIAVSSGKWYCEFTATTSDNMFGLQRAAGTVATSFVGGNADSWGYYSANGNKYNNNSASAYGASYTSNDVIGIAFDADAGTLTFYKNGVSQGQAYSGLTNGPYTFVLGNGTATNNVPSAVCNFGQRPFAYPVSGFKALCDTNLTAPTIAKPSTVFDVKLYTGNGGSQTINGYAFSPDLVWIKQRSGTTDHGLFDTVRGVYLQLRSNTTAGDNTVTNALTSFTSDGYVLGGDGPINFNGWTYVNWAWDAGSSTVTNTQGSIPGTVSVRANQSAGFSIVTYTGAGNTASTVGHGLGVAPQFIVIKNRTDADDWAVYHASITNDYYLNLNSTAAQSNSVNMWNDTSPTSTVFSLGAASGSNAVNRVNNSGKNYVAYCFAPVAGYSSFGSYTGNGSADGPFVYTGFRPRWIMVKASSTTGTWVIHDTARGSYNASTSVFYANDSMAEYTDPGMAVDINSNGFKVRTGTSSNTNSSSVTYLYCAFAESPFQYSRAR